MMESIKIMSHKILMVTVVRRVLIELWTHIGAMPPHQSSQQFARPRDMTNYNSLHSVLFHHQHFESANLIFHLVHRTKNVSRIAFTMRNDPRSIVHYGSI